MQSLEVKDLRRHFGGLRAVDGVSFRVEPGEFVGLIGPNGSGKSTIFNVVAGTLPPSGGQVLLDGEDITGFPAIRSFRRGLVRSFQVPRLFFGMSVLENVLAAARGQRGEQILSAVGRAWRAQERELAERALDLLEFLNLGHVARNRAHDLSGGQMKLLELARSLMADPAVLLLDEPAAGVVPSLADEIFERLTSFQKEHRLTLIVIEHRLEVLFGSAERVLVMNQGRLVADGKPADVAADPAVREAYFGRQQEGDG